MKPRSLVIMGALLLALAIAFWLLQSHHRQDSSSLSPAPAAQTGTPAEPSGESHAAVPASGPTAGRTVVSSGVPARALPASAGHSALPSPNQPPSDVPPPPVIPAMLPPATGVGAEVEASLEKINLMLRDYRTLMGENPVGTNAEIMKAIMGANPKGAKLGPPEGLSLNGYGELVDSWGTPFFFHQISGTHMEIWSAGPDKKMGTTDDIIQK